MSFLHQRITAEVGNNVPGYRVSILCYFFAPLLIPAKMSLHKILWISVLDILNLQETKQNTLLLISFQENDKLFLNMKNNKASRRILANLSDRGLLKWTFFALRKLKIMLFYLIVTTTVTIGNCRNFFFFELSQNNKAFNYYFPNITRYCFIIHTS